MKNLLNNSMFLFVLITVSLAGLVTGCQQAGDVKITFVIEGQPVPFDGYNFGPGLYLKKGEPAKVTGFLFWGDGLDPNDLWTYLNDPRKRLNVKFSRYDHRDFAADVKRLQSRDRSRK